MLYLLSFLLFFRSAQAEPKTQIQRFSMHSKALQKTMHYTLWIPQETAPKEGFPLLVMLHGLGDSDSNWSKTHIPKLYKQAREEGLATHIVLCPDGERGYWVDQLGNNNRYASWVLEAIQEVESQYNITEDRGFRSLMGLSMGAWGALSIGLQHPEEFGQLIAMSPTDVFLAVKKQPKSALYTSAFGKPIHPPFIASKEPRELILRGAGVNQRIAIIYGSAELEKFSKGAQRLIATAQAQNIEIESLVIPDGKHLWTSTWAPDSFLWWMRWLKDTQNP